MKTLIAIALIATLLASTSAHARKDCAELKSEIAARIDAKGVPSYTLQVVAAEATTTTAGTVVGSCNGGTQRIVYQKVSGTSESLVASEPK